MNLNKLEIMNDNSPAHCNHYVLKQITPDSCTNFLCGKQGLGKRSAAGSYEKFRNGASGIHLAQQPAFLHRRAAQPFFGLHRRYLLASGIPPDAAARGFEL